MDQIEEVRSKVDIVELINQYVPLKKAGRSFRVNCPFHQEKTPSFFVSPELQIFKCFGCGRGGSVFNFLMEMEGLSFGETLRMLAEKTGVKLQKYELSKEEKVKDKLLEINHLASEFYHFLLTKHPLGKRALDYLLKRGVLQSSIKLFKIGYAPDGWRNLSGYLIAKKKFASDLLEKAGLVIKGTSSRYQQTVNYYDRFRGRIIFPLFDHRGRIVGFSGRVLEEDLKGAKYINSPETVLYHKSAVLFGLDQTKNEIKKEKIAVVVEGEFDLISSFQAGVKNVVAIKGSALTKEQVQLLKRFAENLFLGLDADLAGDSACRRGIKIAEQEGLNIRVIEVKEGKDPDDLAQADPQKWREMVKRAVPIYDFYLDSTVKRFNLKSPEDKRRVTEEVLPLLSEIENEVVKAHYLKKLGELLGVSEEVISQELVRQQKFQVTRKMVVQEKVKKKILRQDLIEEEILSWLLQNEEIFEKLVKILVDEKVEKYFEEGIRKKILTVILTKKKLKVKDFIKKLAPELQDLAGELFLREFKLTENKEEREFKSLILELKKKGLKEELGVLAGKIRIAEQKKEEKTLGRLQKEFVEKSKLLREIMVEL